MRANDNGRWQWKASGKAANVNGDDDGTAIDSTQHSRSEHKDGREDEQHKLQQLHGEKKSGSRRGLSIGEQAS